MNLKIKICGMREPGNIIDVAQLNPDLMGFIFYPHSPRYIAEHLDPSEYIALIAGIKKVGVFVNADLREIQRMISKYSLDVIQLHGNESPDTCRRLRETGVGVIKTFHIGDRDACKQCSRYISDTDFFLFDTRSGKYGGSGEKFNWKILDKYDPGHPFFLSGGIGPDDLDEILRISNPSLYGIDLNSRFEIEPGLKNAELLKEFMNELHGKTI